MLSKFFFVALLTLFSPGNLQANKPEKLESILDKLEQKLLEKERETLSFSLPEERKKEPKAKMKFTKPEKITSVKKNSDFDELSRVITQIENESENLANKIKALQQEVLQKADFNNHIQINTNLPANDSLSFRQLTIKIDGLIVYDHTDNDILWMSNQNLPLFNGPMQPGKHKLQFQARLVTKKQETLPVNSDQYYDLQKDFEINIPPEKVRKNIQIEVVLPENNTNKIDIKMIENTEKEELSK